MSASTFVLALAAALLGQPGTPTGSLPPFEYVNERAVNVPLRLDPARQAEIKEILLFISQDEGVNWSLTTKARPDQKDITFTVTNDGVYWLRLATIDRFGKQTPENPKTVPPNARFVIDTLKPYLKLTNAQRSGNDIVAAWQVSEDNPSWESFRLEYMSAGSGFPVAVPTASPGISGQVRFTPTSNGPVTVRLTLRDKAGNESMTSTEVAGVDGVVTTAATAPPVQATISPPPPTPLMNAIPSPAPLPQTLSTPPQEIVGTAIPGVPMGDQHFPSPPTRTFGSENRETRNGNTTARWNPAPTTPGGREQQPIASTSMEVQGAIMPAQATSPIPMAAPAPRHPLPPLRYLNSPLVTLEYELAKVGPSGIGSVEIFYTGNDGQTWELLGREKLEVLQKLGAGRHPAEVQLGQDGVYGFTIVVKSNAQLKQEALADDVKPHGPQSGDVPEIRVEVDTMAPSAELFPPRRDTAKQNSLVLFWKASDKNLGTNPITLEWSDQREGPWNAIASNLPNVGKHSWQLPDRLPVEVYLRLRVTDLAGNDGIATTPQPITVDLSEPEGRLTSVTVSPRR